MMTRETFLSSPITTLHDGKAWITALHARGMMFHFEDDPAEIIMIADGARLFSDDECDMVRDRIDELYALDWSAHRGCPIGFALELMQHEWDD